MIAAHYRDVPAEFRTFTAGRKWFSENDDKAWGEKFYLIFIPIFFAYNAVIQQKGWLDVGNFWHVAQNLLMWLPYCVILPIILRRNTGIPYRKQWWFKFQLYMAMIVFVLTYFHTEFFFEILGMRYNFPQVTLYLDSALLGPDQATALARNERIPVGMYLNTMAFFTVYHSAAIVVIRRLYNLGRDLSGRGAASARASGKPGIGDNAPAGAGAQWAGFAVAAAAGAFFFAWAETFFYMTAAGSTNVWYINLPWQLKVGSWFYMTYFIFTFPNIYWLDETRDRQPWSLSRTVINAAAMTMFILIVDDLWVVVGLPVVPGPAS